MGIKLFVPSLEFKAIKSILMGDEKTSSIVYSRLSKEFFHHGPTKEAYQRITAILRSSGDFPTWDALCSDPIISESARLILKANEEKPIRKYSEKSVENLLGTLDMYRKCRGLYNAAKLIEQNLEADRIDADKVTEELSNMVSHIRTGSDSEHLIYHIGKNNNSTQLVRELLDNSKKQFVPTGFRVFDDKNGGFPYGSLVLVAATTGAGKTTMANQLFINMTTKEYTDCVLVSLEMSEDRIMSRVLGNLGELPVTKVTQKRLSPDEKKVMTATYRKLVNKLKVNKTRYSIFSPKRGVTIEDVFAILRPYNYKVTLVDYIGLLEGADGDDQWKQLSKIARVAKVYAEATGNIVILLAQLNDEGKLKYSKGPAEHADIAWFWKGSDEQEDVSTLEIRQHKARNLLKFPFRLKSDNITMRVSDMDDYDNSSSSTDENDEGEGNTRVKVKRAQADKATAEDAELDKYLGDINDQDGE